MKGLRSCGDGICRIMAHTCIQCACTMMAKPMKALEMQCPMIQFFSNAIYIIP